LTLARLEGILRPMNSESVDRLRTAIRNVPDFPKPGILFKDITPILGDGALFRLAVECLLDGADGEEIDKIVGIDARGFIFGAALAHHLGVGFVPVRKKGKLPHTTRGVAYALEYGEAEVEIHVDAVRPGERVLIIDDLLATGGTAAAAVELVQGSGAEIVGIAFLIELTFLAGRAKLPDVPVWSVLVY
jgi:adenine phosphoribosyltransferase